MPWPRRFALAALLVSVSPGAAYAQGPAAPVIFEAPAGRAPAGRLSLSDPFVGILPSGRYLHPTGASVFTGTNALGVTLTPSGRFAIISNDDDRQSQVGANFDPLGTAGPSLAVVDTRTMRVVSRYKEPGESFFVGVVALRDPVDATKTLVLASGGPSDTVYALDLDAAGTLSADAHHTIAMPPPAAPAFADNARAFPGTIVLGPGGSRAYVVDNLGNDVVQVDTAARAVVGTPVPVGFFPLAAALGSTGLLVANEGSMRYAKVPSPAAAPPFTVAAADLDLASSLSIVPRYADGSLATGMPAAVPLDPTPDGVRTIGGAHPAAVVAMRRKPYAFVAMSNVDRVATISLASAAPRAVGGTELRLYDRGPYGTQPDALALASDEKRLYVALAGIDAIAVLDVSNPARPHRVGLISTGWYPSALALSRDGRYLYVANAKGEADASASGSTLERIDLKRLDLRRTTPLALSYLRTVRPARTDAVVPQRFASAGSVAIKHVVLLLEENETYDAMLGDLKDASGAPYGPGEPNDVAFDGSATPNLHALARTYALAGNIYADAQESGAAHQFVAAGIATAYTEKTLPVKDGRRPTASQNEDPEDYPRAGYIFNSLADRGLTYRDYGDFVRLSGYDAALPAPSDAAAATRGLGGSYSLDVPALAALSGHIDLDYPGWNARIGDGRRAAEFLRDFDSLVKADRMPDYTCVWLPNGSDGGASDGDRALGQIVDYLTHIPQWSSTAIFVVPAGARAARDHVNAVRTYAIVVSPYAKHHVVGTRHLSTVSVLKTEEELLGLPSLSLGDALATDMSDLFTPTPDLTPYERVDAAPRP
jgi:DNA-binding beta-propeller fold protein YncE